MSYTIIRPENRQAWLKEREQGIGSSEVATILGVNPYETPLQLWRRKMHIDPPKEEDESMLMGHLLEDAVAKRWAKATGLEIIKSSVGDWLMVDNDRPFLRVSPDRTYWLPDMPKNNFNKGIVEIKTTQLDIDKDSIPQNWFCQLQYQLGVSGYEQGFLAWLKLDWSYHFGTTDIKFDRDFYGWMVEEIEKFWVDNIKGCKEPDPMDVPDILIKFPKHTTGKTIEASAELVEACAELKMLKEQEASIKQAKTDLEDRIKMALGDAEALTCKGMTLASWKAAKDSSKFDEKAFSAEHADLYNLYKKVVPGSRRFLVK